MSLDGDFQSASPLPSKKRPPPFSLRLSGEERERLLLEAAGAPLGAFIKAKVLGGPVPAPRRQYRSAVSVEDRAALAQILGVLGRARIANNLNQLAHLANIGALPLTPEIEGELLEALRDIRDVRRLLLLALGFKAEDRPSPFAQASGDA